MARLLILTRGFDGRAVDLHLGVNHVGRDPDCEIFIDHPTISSLHCELALSGDGVYVRDCRSTNGTFINDEPVWEAWLDPGNRLRLGDVELLVESTDAKIAIPEYKRPSQIKPPPMVLSDGTLTCPRHDSASATYRCTHCREVMCNACVRILRRRGGKPHFLCVLCGNECEPVRDAPTKKKKRGLFSLLRQTVKLRFPDTDRAKPEA